MAVTRISIDTPFPVAADRGDFLEIANQPEGVHRISRYFDKIAGGGKTAKVRLNTGAVQAEGAVAFASFADADTVTINGTLVTGKTSPSGASQFAVGSSDEACANNFYTLIKASALDKIVGVVAPYRRGTITLSSFADGDTVTINGLVFTGKTTPDNADPRQFAIGVTDTVTAANLLAALNDCHDLYYANLGKRISWTVSGAVLTLDFDKSTTFAASAHATLSNKIVQMRSIVGGQIGNLMTLAISAHGSKTDPAGGTEGTETIFAQSRQVL